MIWTWYKDSWLVSRKAAKLFFVSTILVFSMVPLFLNMVDTTKMAFWTRLPWGLLLTLGPIAALFLYFGMWRYWACIDSSRSWTKRIWFFILLLGIWWGSCLYCLVVYLPQVFRKIRAEA